MIDIHTTIVEKLKSLWSSMLKCEMGIHDDFYESGGDSLMTIDVLEQITDIFSVDITLEEFFNNSTLEQCAALIKHKLGSSNVTL